MRPEVSPAGLTRRTSRGAMSDVSCCESSGNAPCGNLTQRNLRIRMKRSWPNHHSGYSAAGLARVPCSGLLFEIPRSWTGPCAASRAGRYGSFQRPRPRSTALCSRRPGAPDQQPADEQRPKRCGAVRARRDRDRRQDILEPDHDANYQHTAYTLRFVQSQLAVFVWQARQVAAAITCRRPGEHRDARSPRRS
jgi:hypothetical protein